MRCDHRLWGEADGLVCTQTGEHRGHVYTSSAGSELGEGSGHAPEGDEG